MNIETKKFGHIMLDLETMGTNSFSAIISIAALEFDIQTGETGREFYVNVDLQSCMDIGLSINAATIMWWLNQNEQARKDLIERVAIYPIKAALALFSDFCRYEDYQIWGNSARFDCGILQNAYDKLGMKIPWAYWNERCVRTLVSFNPDIRNNYPAAKTSHNALSDCYYQVGYCCEIWKTLNFNVVP